MLDTNIKGYLTLFMNSLTSMYGYSVPSIFPSTRVPFMLLYPSDVVPFNGISFYRKQPKNTDELNPAY